MKYGPQNNNWRGGRVRASNGYVLLRVGEDHHLADVRGYAYEHRVVAERLLGRRLAKGEIVHHIDGDKANNAPANLEVCAGRHHHGVKHRSLGSELRLPGEPNPVVACACGCMTRFLKFDGSGRPRRFVSGHNMAFPSPGNRALMELLQLHGPRPRRWLAEQTGRTVGAIACALTKLKKRGVATSERGYWRLIGDARR